MTDRFSPARPLVKIRCIASVAEARLAVAAGAQAMADEHGAAVQTVLLTSQQAAMVAAVVGAVRPFGVDLCRGVRQAGRLDAARLAAFFAALPAG